MRIVYNIIVEKPAGKGSRERPGIDGHKRKQE
jgi:hypothetical protein